MVCETGGWDGAKRQDGERKVVLLTEAGAHVVFMCSSVVTKSTPYTYTPL